MNSTLRAVVAALTLSAAFAAAVPAQDAAPGATGVLDEGRLVTFHGDVPVGTETFQYRLQNDSLVVTSATQRRWRRADGAQVQYNKAMTLTARADDFGLLNYVSNEATNGHVTTRSLLLADTVLTGYTEIDGAGTADVLERPPGRIFTLDASFFTLFDVIGRNLQHRIFGSRPVQLVVFGENAMHVEATATQAGPDTVTWGGHRVVTQRIALRDSSSAFTLWLSPEGHMLRLEGEDGRLVVMREPPEAPAAARRPRARRR